jgi:hypothetical protein
MNDAIESVREKVTAIFGELAGDRASRLDASTLPAAAMHAVASALGNDYGPLRSQDIALHLCDWNWDAAFITALHLFPERFTAEEITAGTGLFFCHAPNHIREACRLTDTYVWESFPDENESIAAPEIASQRVAVTTIPNKGRGVVALRPFAAGETIERPPVIVIPREEAPLIRDTRLAHYYFEWGDDCQQAAIALGCGSLYNHSYTPNARYEFREDEECLEFIALCDIQPGEEITINYNNLGPSKANALKFDVK